jgi:hypothetical protein
MASVLEVNPNELILLYVQMVHPPLDPYKQQTISACFFHANHTYMLDKCLAFLSSGVPYLTLSTQTLTKLTASSPAGERRRF